VSPDAPDYFLEIEAHFALRRGTPFILSSKDWLLMKEWKEAGVPLAVVVEAIDAVFEKNAAGGRRKTISSLSYCKHAIRELWDERKELYVGQGETVPEAESADLLETLARELESAAAAASDANVAAAIAAVVGDVRQLVSERSVPKAEERLMELEGALIDRVIAAMSTDEAQQLRDDVTRAIGSGAKLDEATRRRTEEANLRRLVRQRFALPRLSLFG
jgi:hypothetical protein